MSWGFKRSENGRFWAFKQCLGDRIGLSGPLEWWQVVWVFLEGVTSKYCFNIHWFVRDQTFTVTRIPCRLSHR